MRPTATLLVLLLLALMPARAQTVPVAGPRPLVVTEDIALPLSSTQVEQAVRKLWPFTFGQEPGARLLQGHAGDDRVDGTARFNFRSSAINSRLQTLGVITYHISIQAANGQCRVRISQFEHSGNRNAPDGAVNLGLLYAGQRPQERVAGVSLGTAERLHEDMRQQVTQHLQDVLKAFGAQLRLAAGQQ